MMVAGIKLMRKIGIGVYFEEVDPGGLADGSHVGVSEEGSLGRFPDFSWRNFKDGIAIN